MFRAGDTIINPVTGEQVRFLQTASETNGEVVIVETIVQPGGFVAGAHVHPHQEERFHVTDGRVGFRAGWKTLMLEAGGRVTVPAGTPHKFWNAGDRRARFLCEVRPALHFEELIETMFALAAAGRTNRKGMPNLLQLAVIAQAYSDTLQMPVVPARLQQIALDLAAPVGRRLGYEARGTGSPQTARPERATLPFGTAAPTA